MIGNGFDLSYSLPTKYLNFLNVIEYLHGIYRANPHQLQEINTVADILDNEGLCQKDSSLAACYEKYEVYYKVTPIDEAVVELLAELPVTNMWCSFLIETFNQDRGWIDFEQEIATVLEAFEDFLDKPKSVFDLKTFPENATTRFIISHFLFFAGATRTGSYRFKPEFMIEQHKGSGAFYVNYDLLVEQLRRELLAFSDALRLYLLFFVDKMVMQIPANDWANEWFVKIKPDYVVSLNYTSTFEHFCPSSKIAHVHGNNNNSIVLGINADKNDDLATADTTFIAFKKYYQRIVFGTDNSYMSIIDEIKPRVNQCILTVMGHSLDITDRDIILELFELSGEINILYHSQSALGTYIAKLIELFGKEGFDQIRYQKKLKFVSLSDDLDAFVEDSIKKPEIPLLPQVYTF